MAHRRMYRMRAQDSGLASPGYVYWMVAGAPDSTAAQAPAPVGVYSNIFIAEEWFEPDRQQTITGATAALDSRASTVLLSNGTVTVPVPSFLANETYTFKSVGSSSSVVNLGGATVDGLAAATIILYGPKVYITLQSRSTEWNIIGGNREDNLRSTAVTPNDLFLFDGTVVLLSAVPMIFNLLSIAVIGSKRYTFIADGVSNVTLTPFAGNTIAGAATFTLLAGDRVTLHSDAPGLDWHVVAVA